MSLVKIIQHRREVLIKQTAGRTLGSEFVFLLVLEQGSNELVARFTEHLQGLGTDGLLIGSNKVVDVVDNISKEMANPKLLLLLERGIRNKVGVRLVSLIKLVEKVIVSPVARSHLIDNRENAVSS